MHILQGTNRNRNGNLCTCVSGKRDLGIACDLCLISVQWEDIKDVWSQYEYVYSESASVSTLEY